MKKKLLQFSSLLCLLLAFVTAAKAQSIYLYSNATTGAYASLAPNLTATTLGLVGSWGSNTPCSNGGGISGITVSPSFSTYSPTNASSPALNVNITPNAGYVIKVTSISVALRRSSTGPTKARLAYSTDGGTTWIDDGVDYSPNNASCGSFSAYTWTLATPANVCSGMLKVRVYYFAAGAATGTCQTVNLGVNGTVTPLSTPSVSIAANPSTPICAGTNVTFTAMPVSPGTAPVYTWKKNGSPVGTNSITYSDNTLTGTDVISCSMVSNAPCASTASVSSNNISIVVNQPVTSIVYDTVCFMTTFPWGSQSPGTTGTYTQVFTNYKGCDSTVTLHLFVRNAIGYTFNDTICAEGTYNWAGLALNTTGGYNHTFTSYTGCDSSVTLNLFVRNAISNTVADTICAGTTLHWGNQNLTTTGSYDYTFTAYTGCDSDVTMNLFVRPLINHTFSDTICAAATYSWAGQTFSGSGTFSHTFTSYTTCDSIVTLHLFVRPAVTYTFADTICATATYNWGGQSFTATGTYNHAFTGYTGCDSTVTLHLFVRNAITHTFADTICAAATYNWASQSFAATGTYNHTFTSYTGCDSVVTLHLFMRPAITHVFADTICAAATYTWGGQSWNGTGTYNHTFTSYTGCDSVVTLNLFVRPAINFAFADTICAATTYNWASQTFTVTGNYNHTFTSYTGCDSAVILHLFVRPAITHSFVDTICAATTYSWAGQSFTSTGTYNHTFTSYTSCDSIVTLHLFVRPAVSFAFVDTICATASYAWGGQTFTTSGTYIHTFAAYTNCDSIVTLHLFVRPVNANAVTHTICSGTTYVFGPLVLGTAGIYSNVFTDVHGCDSTVTLTLNITPLITNTISATICAATSYNWGTQVETVSGTYTQTFTAASGCDSIVTLNLTVSPALGSTLTQTICYGTTYTLGTQVYNASGTYTKIFTGASGCDSTVVLHLTVSPQITHAASASICYGHTYTFGTQVLSAEGIYTGVFTAASGCDSTVTLSLNVSPQPILSVIDTAGCGSVYFEGLLYNANTVLTDTFHSTAGCDSVYRTVHVSVHGNVPVIKTIDTMGCNTVVFEGTTYTQSTLLSDTAHTTLGCDSVVRHIYITVGHSGTFNVDKEICAGSTLNFADQQFDKQGTYPLAFTNRSGCDSTIILNLTVNPLPHVQVTEVNPLNHCIGDSVLLQATGAYTYNWSNVWGTADEAQFKAFLITNTNPVSVQGIDQKGCADSASIVLMAQHCCNVWMPNAFSPNGDGLNDVFIPKTMGHPTEYTMHIFNRWGENIYTSFNIEKGWDGTIKGKTADVATYHYFITGKCTNGEPLNLKGSFTLIR
jgi:gliding motility-associated-like protein